MIEFLARVVFRAFVALVWVLALLSLWNIWPTDGTPAPEIGGPHFHIGG